MKNKNGADYEINNIILYFFSNRIHLKYKYNNNKNNKYL